MDITDVRVRLSNGGEGKLKAFCSLTFDGEFVVQDIKVIDGPGGLFIAMPCRKLSERCPDCGTKNHLRANFCNECGVPLREPAQESGERRILHADVAHPINADCRDRIHHAVVEGYRSERDRLARLRRGFRPSAGRGEPEDRPQTDY